MSSEGLQINYAAAALGMLALAITLIGLTLLLLTQKMALSFPIVFCGFAVFVTTAMMCAKTTGGPQD